MSEMTNKIKVFLNYSLRYQKENQKSTNILGKDGYTANNLQRIIIQDKQLYVSKKKISSKSG